MTYTGKVKPGGDSQVRTFGDTKAFTTLLEDVSTKVFARLPDQKRFYSGHGDDSDVGQQRPHLAEWRERGW